MVKVTSCTTTVRGENAWIETKCFEKKTVTFAAIAGTKTLPNKGYAECYARAVQQGNLHAGLPGHDVITTEQPWVFCGFRWPYYNNVYDDQRAVVFYKVSNTRQNPWIEQGDCTTREPEALMQFVYQSVKNNPNIVRAGPKRM